MGSGTIFEKGTPWARGMLVRLSLLLVFCLFAPGGGLADGGLVSTERAPLYLDGQFLFDVRGASAFPAKQRARAIRDRLIAAAEDDSFDPNAIELRESEYGIDLLGSGHRLMTVIDADARAEGLETRLLAEAVRRRIVSAVREYRQVRSPEGVRHAIEVAAIATVVFAVSMTAIVLLARLASRIFSRYLRGQVEALERRSQHAFNLGDVLGALQGGVRWLFIILGLVALYYYVSTVLFALPWTRGVAVDAFAFVTDPLLGLANGIVESIPGLIAILAVIVIVRYLLKSLHAFFDRVRWGRIRLANFEAEWARPTERLIRIGVIAVAAVIAYPFIPGSGSEAFKGLTLFAGLVLSLGSSSIIANIIAGYSMIYRRAFQVGDRVSILGTVGEVEDMRILSTHVRTPKNERVTFPNSLILNSQVVNYTMMAKEQALILHTEVGIGYEVPWRQVESMLLEAAARTPDVLRDPPPFVLQTRLADFSPVYELNAYTANARRIPFTYSALHANIQDVFAEAEVQIMTPSYESDPEQPKVPPRNGVEQPVLRP